MNFAWFAWFAVHPIAASSLWLVQPAGIWSTTTRPVALTSLSLNLPGQSFSWTLQGPNSSTASSRLASSLDHSSGRAPLMGALQRISRY
jgi:hypothetical protein